jgi:tetratricopeptide (TPR) repeat protein
LTRALELDPSSGEIYPCNLHAAEVLGQPEDAIAKVRRAIEQNLHSVMINSELGCASYYAQRYDQAIASLQEASVIDPGYIYNYWGLARVYGQKGMHEEALAALAKTKALAGNWPAAIAEIGYNNATAGRKDEAQKRIQELKGIAVKGYVDPYPFAIVYAGLGENERVLALLEKAYQEQSAWMPWMAVEPKFKNLHSDMRFKNL